MSKQLLASVGLAAALLSLPAIGKLPAPSDDAKAKAAEAAAKAAHGNKVADFQLCKSRDNVAAAYFAQAKKEGKVVKPADATAACADPGAFVYTPPAPVSAAASAAPSAVATAPAAPKK